jgi:cytoskeletal protein RodZ
MFKRLFWLTLGVIAGFTGSWWIQQRVKQTVDRFAPDNLQADAKAAVAEGRDAARRREQELRDRYRPPGQQPASR